MIIPSLKFVGALAALALAVFCLFFPGSASPSVKRIFLVGWLVIPPAFHYFEYLVVGTTLVGEKLEGFKYVQGLSAAIWAGVAAALAAVYFKDA